MGGGGEGEDDLSGEGGAPDEASRDEPRVELRHVGEGPTSLEEDERGRRRAPWLTGT